MGSPTVAIAVLETASSVDAPSACHWAENPKRLMSLWDMIDFRPDIFTFWLKFSAQAPWLFDATDEAWDFYRSKLSELRQESARYDFRSIPPQIDKILVQIGPSGPPPISIEMLNPLFLEVGVRLREEMRHPAMFIMPVPLKSFYETPLKGWEAVIGRYHAAQLTEDISEAGRCFATDRLTACVFHLMRIVELAVIDLHWLTGLPDDQKAHFGSVVSKLEILAQRTEFHKLPDVAKPHINFLKDILPYLHAVKDSWRNKVSHADGRILPTGGYNTEDVSEMYMATRGLMKTMAENAPAKP